MKGYGTLITPLLIIAVGVGWLLSTLQVLPGVHWVWVLALGVIGLLVLASGINKVSIAVGPFFLICSVFAILRQTGRLSVDVEVPLLTITAGVLLLVARLLPVPAPPWMLDRQRPAD